MSTTPIPSAEQQARELLGRMNIPGADTMTAGDLVELGNLIAAHWQRGAALDAERAAVANINAARRHEADRLTAENQRLRAALDYLEQHILRGTLAINLHPDASGPENLRTDRQVIFKFNGTWEVNGGSGKTLVEALEAALRQDAPASTANSPRVTHDTDKTQ